MAVARGQQQAGGVTAVHIWLIAFVALWLVSTVGLVWLYTDQERLSKQADDARASMTASQSEKRALQQSMGRIAELAVGSTDDDETTVADKIDTLYDRIRDEQVVAEAVAFDDLSAGLLANMTTLYEAYVREHEGRSAAEERAQSMADEVERLTAAQTKREQDYAEKVDDLAGQVRGIEGDHTQYRQDRDDEMDSVRTQMDEREQVYTRNIQEQRTIASQRESELEEYKSRYEDLQEKLGELQIKPAELLTARVGDGVVLTAKAGEDVVYINLGRRQKITLGMAFAVHSADQEIPADGRAKARIEVVRIFEDSAECVIREVFGRSLITEGDVINNPVYERDRPLAFVVTGRFDLDGDGLDDRDGADRIKALIRSWGGKVLEALSARVDFVVVGSVPPAPSALGDLSAEQAERQATVRREFEAYSAAVEAAQALSVPILTQDVFLHFLGYAGRPVNQASASVGFP